MPLLLESSTGRLLLESGSLLLAENPPHAALGVENGDRLAMENGGRLAVESPPGVFDVPASIPADGSVDVTAELQAWLDSVPNGATARLAAAGLYWTEGPLLLEDRAGFTFDGNGATLEAFTDGSGVSPPHVYFNPNWPRKRTRVTVLGGSGVTVTNLILRGGNPNAGTGEAAYVAALEAQHGCEFVNTAGGAFTNSQVYDVYGDFAYTQGSIAVTISGNYMRRNGRQGVSIVKGSSVRVAGNDIADVRRATFDIEANVDTDELDDIHIEDNTTGAGRLLWLANAGQSWHISNVHIKGNVMTAATGVPVIQVTNNETGGKRGPYLIEGNTFIVGGSSAPAFRFDNVDGVAFHGNTATFDPARAMTAVRFTDTSGTVAGNTFIENAVDVRVESA